MIEAWGLRAPRWLGAAMALAGPATVLPALRRHRVPVGTGAAPLTKVTPTAGQAGGSRIPGA